MKTIKLIEIRAKRIPIAAEDRAAYSHGGAIRSDADVIGALRALLPRDLDREHFVVLVLDTGNKILGSAIVAMGSAGQCAVDMREVFRPAVVLNGSGIIVAHNHPSDNPEPSAEDLKITRRIRDGADLLGITLLDHVILGDGYVSLAARGAL